MKELLSAFLIVLCIINTGVAACGRGSCNRGGDGSDYNWDLIKASDGRVGFNMTGNDCYACNFGDNSIECDPGTVFVVMESNSTDLHVKEIRECRDDDPYDDDWVEQDILNICSDSPLTQSAAHNGVTYKKLSTRCTSRDGVLCMVSSVNGAACHFYGCKPGYKPNAAGTDCEVDTSAQETCTNSHGEWDATNSKCVCDRNKGLENDGGAKCKCSDSSHIWNDAEGKCVDPNAAAAAACNESGGDWEGGECKCDTGKGLTGPNSDGKCYCSDSAKLYDSVTKQCTDSPETVCKNTGGNWKDSKCNCEAYPDKNIKKKDGSNPVQCECTSEDYEWITGKENEKGCVLSNEAQERINAYNDLKRDCEKWGGVFSPKNYEDDRKPENWECKCPNNAGVKQRDKVNCQCDIDNGYMREEENSQYFCKQSTCDELKDLCNKATDEKNTANVTELIRQGVVHGREACYCKCKDSNKIYDKGQNKCIADKNPRVEICRLYGAIVGKNGECVCESTGLPPETGKTCPTSTSNGNASSGTVATVTDTRDKEENIKTLYGQLTSISDGFKKSHWKTASGNFNGARLASDSIAGVVLGTVGGVVTSNVIKKNQVKGGFESLQCTVGGQLVADFGDQFQVGIR